MALQPPGFIPMSSSYTVELFGWHREGHEEAEDGFSARNFSQQPNAKKARQN